MAARIKGVLITNSKLFLTCTARPSLALLQSVAVRGMQRQTVNIPELLNLFEGLGGKRRLTFKSMQYNAFQQIAQSHVLQFGDCLQHLDQPLFHPDAGLNPFHLNCHMYQCTTVKWSAVEAETPVTSSEGKRRLKTDELRTQCKAV